MVFAYGHQLVPLPTRQILHRLYDDDRNPRQSNLSVGSHYPILLSAMTNFNPLQLVNSMQLWKLYPTHCSLVIADSYPFGNDISGVFQLDPAGSCADRF
jgi:hypothetical protein